MSPVYYIFHCTLFFYCTEPDDYSRVVTQITFSAGSGVGSQQCINVSIVNDNVVEMTEQFSLSLAAGQNSVIGFPDTATVEIIDDDCKSIH